jgi:hypothetical protein
MEDHSGTASDKVFNGGGKKGEKNEQNENSGVTARTTGLSWMCFLNLPHVLE